MVASGCSSLRELKTSGHHNAGAIRAEPQEANPEKRVGLDRPARSQPVTAVMTTIPAEVGPDEIFEVLVRLQIAESYHIYASNVAGKPFIPISLKLTIPDGLKASSGWIAPPPDRTRTDEHIYTDSVLFRRSLKMGSKVPAGPLSIDGELLYQACREDLCWPPRMIKLSCSVGVNPLKR